LSSDLLSPNSLGTGGAASVGSSGAAVGGAVKSAFSGESDVAERFSDTVADP